jgi:hypothetical protein
MSIFLDNKYTRWYYAIIEKRAITERRLKGEVHHILPKSLGGDDDPQNLVKLSGHDHAWCHWLLTKMTEGEDRAKMIYAFNMMSVAGEHMKREKSYAIVRAYEKNRLEWSKTHSEKMRGKEPWNKGKKLDDEKYKKAGWKNKGRVRTQEAIDKCRLKVIGRKDTEETKLKKRESMLGFVRGPMSDEEKLKRSIALIGKAKPDGHGEKVAAAVLGNISINKDGKERKVKQHQLQEFLDDGWALGGRPRTKRKAT